MTRVFVLNVDRKPLTPCTPVRARILLSAGRAAVFRRYPFTIILKDQLADPVVNSVRVKIDPGANVTGLVLVFEHTNVVAFAAELEHRGQVIKAKLYARSLIRKSRRARNTRYRKARFLNRRRIIGWLAPSLRHLIETIRTWVFRFMRLAPVSSISLELAKFDTQLLQNPDISGAEYQHGELAGYELKEALLEKWGRVCVYCGSNNVPLNVEHIIAKARGGTNRFSNLTLSCKDCNIKKGALTVEEFLVDKPDLLERIKNTLRKPLISSSAVNATRSALLEVVRSVGLPVETGSGGRTKYNRTKLGLPKAHWIDAACIGVSGERLVVSSDIEPLCIKAMGHGTRQMCGVNKYGFPVRYRTRKREYFGLRTGDMVKAVLLNGKNVGAHIGRVSVRARGDSFLVNGLYVSPRRCSLLQHTDGYSYSITKPRSQLRR